MGVVRMRRFWLSGVVLAVLVAVALAAAVPAGAEAPPPTIKCDSSKTVVHWDAAYLAKHYGTEDVTSVEVVWTVILGFKVPESTSSFDGHNARFNTAFTATRAFAKLTLLNGKSVDAGPGLC
jgi:hypothetical protein